jgi:hypothetical protein
MAEFPFSDLHSFRDYVAFVRLCSPDEYPIRAGVASDEQWTLDSAVDGLRYGLTLSSKETGEVPVLETCQRIVEEAFQHYRDGQVREGFRKLQEVEKLLKRLKSK